ncbi:hypothetical protein BDP27DRAFT_1319853 [Rhodocollybia butyracea]|uniref:HMG box domain-containing protein n=1 Tax=Rhodocollybia butyracea TaxID=206335 RepID=A0A9P5PZE1_9AGAR|nr:hypothetical protein BDP27DRAFT_1319853 [Rhodocollybia butyracea]
MYRSAWCTENKDQPDAEKDHRKVSRMLGAQWKLLSKAEQEPYRRMAEAEAREHALMYPGYKYKPTSRGKRSAKWAGRKAFRDTRADQEKCDRIVRELFIIKSPAIKPKIEASASPDLVSSPIPSQPPSADDELVYPADEFVPTEDIPYLDLDASEESKVHPVVTLLAFANILTSVSF